MGVAGCIGNVLQKCGSGGPTLPVVPTGATAGAPGAFVPAGATPPADLAALQALGDLGQTTVWDEDDYIDLGDASKAHWDGAAWAAGVAPAVVPPPPPVSTCPDPGSMTVAAASDYASDHHECAQEMLDAEQAGQARVTLLEHLQHIIDSH